MSKSRTCWLLPRVFGSPVRAGVSVPGVPALGPGELPVWMLGTQPLDIVDPEQGVGGELSWVFVWRSGLSEEENVVVFRKVLVSMGAAVRTVTKSGSSVNSGAEDGEKISAPVIVAPDVLADGEVTISREIALMLDVDFEDAEEWTAKVADPSVAGFSQGGSRDGAEFAPGFTGVKVGSTDVALTAADGSTIEFTITVAANNADVKYFDQ